MSDTAEPQGAGEVILDIVLPPRGYTAVELRLGQLMRVTDLDGQQVCDLVCFARDDPHERFATHPTIMRNGTIFLTTGHSLYSTNQRQMLTIVSDDVGPGGHDLLAGMCSQTSNEAKFGVAATPNCTGNLIAALAAWHIPPTAITDSFNAFMDMKIDPEGAIAIQSPKSMPGDCIVFKAQMDLVVGLSNCPQEWGATNARSPSRIGLTIASGD